MKGALAMVGLALVFVPCASAVESTIYPGVGIGKVKLGMTPAQVERSLGRYRYVNERDGRHLSVGWGFGVWTVDFVGKRVVQVATTLRTQRTPTGVGPGASWRRLVRAYPHGVCTFTISGSWGLVEYLVPHKGGTQTVYLVPQPREEYGGVPDRIVGKWRVSEVHVRTPFVQLPEFAPSWKPSCKEDWRTSDAPL
jgi:hypothetical protein